MNSETTAGDLRAARMASASSSGAADNAPLTKGGGSFRERVMAARQAKERAKKKIEEKITAPAKAATGKVLRWLWGVTFTLIGFIFGLLGLNIYVFLHRVMGDKFFCKLGEEWMPKQVQAAGGESVKTANKAAGFVEVMVLIFLDFAVMLAIFIILVPIIMLIKIAENPKAAIDIFGFGFVWEAIKALF